MYVVTYEFMSFICNRGTFVYSVFFQILWCLFKGSLPTPWDSSILIATSIHPYDCCLEAAFLISNCYLCHPACVDRTTYFYIWKGSYQRYSYLQPQFPCISILRYQVVKKLSKSYFCILPNFKTNYLFLKLYQYFGILKSAIIQRLF